MKTLKLENSLSFLKSFSLPQGWSLEFDSKKGAVLSTSEGLTFSLDFSKPKKPKSQQALIKAIGQKNKACSVLDLTAGWLKDSFLIAGFGCQVKAIESHPFVFHFVKAQLEKQKPAELKLDLMLGDSLSYLKSLKEKPDIIFIDPMFGGRKKSLSQKPLRVLKDLVGETQNKELLFKQALKKAKKKVVIKRHKLDQALSSNFTASFKGHSTCYDIFQVQ